MQIKPLKWYKPTDHPQDREHAKWMAHGVGGRYSITEERCSYTGDTIEYLLWLAGDEFVWKSFKTIDAAKQAAQADFEAEISKLIAA